MNEQKGVNMLVWEGWENDGNYRCRCSAPGQLPGDCFVEIRADDDGCSVGLWNGRGDVIDYRDISSPDEAEAVAENMVSARWPKVPA